MRYMLVYPTQYYGSSASIYEYFETKEEAEKFRNALKDPKIGCVTSKVKLFEINLIDEV